MRVFFAALLSSALRERIISARVPLISEIGQEGARWVDAAELHVTVRFLGELTEDRVQVAIAAAGRAIAGHTAFDIGLGGLGAFPDGHRPRVLWTGLERGAADLAALAMALDDALRSASFRFEERAFHPHVTLARLQSPRAQRKTASIVRRGGMQGLGDVRIDRLVLMESRPKTVGGSRYTEVASFELA